MVGKQGSRMKENLRLLTLLISFQLSAPCTYAQQQEIIPDGYNKFYFPNGRISSEGTMRGGKPDGYWKSYYDNGQLKSEGNRRLF